MKVRYLQIFGDSLLITNHFNRLYAVKGERLIKYLEIVKKLADSFASFSLTQVPREENAGATALANLASPLKVPEDTKIPIIHILLPAITENETTEVEGNNFETSKDPQPIEIFKDPPSTSCQHPGSSQSESSSSMEKSLKEKILRLSELRYLNLLYYMIFCT